MRSLPNTRSRLSLCLKLSAISSLRTIRLGSADILAGAGVSWKVRSVVPNELLCYIRQYRCDIGLFYGRNVGGFISGIGDDEVAMYQQMCQEKPDMTVVTDIAKSPTGFSGPNRMVSGPRDASTSMGIQPS